MGYNRTVTSAASDRAPQDPQWLDDAEMRTWRAYLRAVNLIDRRLNEGLKQAGDLSIEDYEVLVHLSENDDRRLRMSDLSDRLVHSQSRLTQRVDRLAKRGYVSREKCPEDRRGTFACLTDEGFAALEATAPHHVQDVRDALIDLIEPGEHEIVAEVFERIIDRLRPD